MVHMCIYLIMQIPQLRLSNPEALQWCHDGRDGVSNDWHLDGLFNCLFRRRWKKRSKLYVTCDGNSLLTGEFSAQRPTNAEKSFDDVIMVCGSIM